ncbi:hypothetical protein ACHAXS_008156 [Conticribra weissflogii]
MTISVTTADTPPCPSPSVTTTPSSSEPHSSHEASTSANAIMVLESSVAALSICSNNAKTNAAFTSNAASTSSISHNDEDFTIQANPIHGCLSAYASRPIPRRTVILVEAPPLFGDDIDALTRNHDDGTHCRRADDEAFLRDRVGLDEEQCRRIWELHDQFADAPEINPSNDEKRLLGIIKTNAYFSTDKKGLGLYPIISRFNHSCTPNVGYGFDGWNMRLYTTRDVEEGEELNTCYSDMVYFHTREMRKLFLKTKFNFDCVCKGCNPDPSSLSSSCCDGETITEKQPQSPNQQQDNIIKEKMRKSDDRRSRLQFLSQMLSIRNDGQIKRGHLQMILESIRLLREEQLEHNLGPTYRIAYEWARKLKETGSMDGALEEELEGMVCDGGDGGRTGVDGFGEVCLRILEVSLGVNHAETMAFKRKFAEELVT